MADVSDLFIERLYRISDQSFKKCGTSIMLINQEGDVLYKIMPISNYTEARFYQLAYQNTLDTSNVYLDIHTEGTIQNYDFDDINFLVKHQLIPKIYGFFYIKHLLINDNEVWGIVSELDYDCSIAIGLENIIYGYEIPAVADIKLGMSHPMNYTYESDVSSDDIPKYIDKWRSIKSQLRNEYFNDPIKANSLIRQITAQMIGLPSQYHHYSTDDIYNLLKKWRQIQASHDTTQASLGLRICSMNYKNCDSEVTDLTPNISKNFTDNECINHISRYQAIHSDTLRLEIYGELVIRLNYYQNGYQTST